MISKPRRTSSLKYSILKPNHHINSLKSSFNRPRAGCEYECAQNDQIGVRKYKIMLQSLDSFIQNCQWRLQTFDPIVHCLYLELQSPQPKSNSLSMELYVEDIELSLSRMKKLLIPEAIYMILQMLKGFCAIWSKYQEVSLTEEAIGLNCQGKCLVWVNNSLALNNSEGIKLKKPTEITKEVIKLVQTKSEPASHALLAKLLQKILLTEDDFGEVFNFLYGFTKSHQIKVPQNLKYLVFQDRLCKKLQLLQTRRSTIDNKQQVGVLKTPRFIIHRRSLFDRQILTPKINDSKRSIKTHKFLSSLRKTTDLTYNLFTSKLNRQNHSISSSIKKGDLNGSLLQSHRRLRLSNAQQFSAISKISSPRCKCQSFKSIGLPNRTKPQQKNTHQIPGSAEDLKRSNRQLDHSETRTTISKLDKSNLLNNSLFELPTAKGFFQNQSHTSDSKVERTNKVTQFESQQPKASSVLLQLEEPSDPNLRVKWLPVLQGEDPTFHLIPEAEQIIKANKWTTTLRNFLQYDSKLKTSIVLGKEVSSYLEDVRLEKLEGLGKNLSESLSSYGSSKVKQSQDIQFH